MSFYYSHEHCKSCGLPCERGCAFNFLSEEELRGGTACLSVLQVWWIVLSNCILTCQSLQNARVTEIGRKKSVIGEKNATIFTSFAKAKEFMIVLDRQRMSTDKLDMDGPVIMVSYSLFENKLFSRAHRRNEASLSLARKRIYNNIANFNNCKIGNRKKRWSTVFIGWKIWWIHHRRYCCFDDGRSCNGHL